MAHHRKNIEHRFGTKTADELRRVSERGYIFMINHEQRENLINEAGCMFHTITDIQTPIVSAQSILVYVSFAFA